MVVAFVARTASAAPDRLEPDDLPTPADEVIRADAKVDPPAVPGFEIAGSTLEGAHTVKELRVHGRKLLDSTVTVKGVITWVYDCATAIRQPGESERAVKKRIDDDPTLCERPKFYVGDDAKTPPEHSLWVVDVPRFYNKLELTRLPKADRSAPDRCEPGDRAQKVCPPYKVGDVVTIAGDFKLSSPHSERNSDGLLVYKAMQNATQHWETGGTTWTAKTVAPQTWSSPGGVASAAEVPKGKPTRVAVDRKVREESSVHLIAGNAAVAQKKLDVAADEYQKAIARWADNHVAWYGAGGAAALHGDWDHAADAFEHCVKLRPDVAMYQLWYGVALYERAVHAAREDQARRDGRKPEAVTPDLSAVNFEKPLTHLATAAKLSPGLWRAHYYLGRISREQDRAKAAAEEFTAAIRANPREAGPYIALVEIYRRWDYTDAAIAVATQATQNIPGSNEVSDAWFELGMGYDDKHRDAEAIEAFSKALETRKDNAKALFQRGQAYFRKGDRANAKRDLEAFAKSTTAGLDFARAQAQQMLVDLAAKR
jgi:tetratricopeptide (TPR) repeat protein